jgi:hypothetical protein
VRLALLLSLVPVILFTGGQAAGPGPVADEPPRAGRPAGITLPTWELVDLAERMRRSDEATVQWPRWRFLSFAAAPAGELPARQAAVRYALATLNRTAEKPGDYLIPLAPTLWAIDTVRLGWPQAVWEDLGRIERYYSATDSDTLRNFFKAKAGTEKPLLRHDEFVAGCWEPQRYALALDLPKAKDEFLRKFLKPESFQDGAFGVVSKRLTVSRHPGQVARFVGADRPDGTPGVVWMRVLHAEGSEVKLTPGGFDSADHFEFFWRLPNGLDGYVSYDRLGGLSLNGSTTLSRDRDGESVRVGVSCINCHAGGPKSLDHADPANELVLFGLRPEAWDRDKLTFAVRQDQKQWADALQSLIGLAPADNDRVHRWLVASYQKELEPADVARELGVPGPGGKVSRADFTDLAAAAASNRVNQLYLDAARKKIAP